MKPIKDLEISKEISINELINQMKEGGGFTAKKLGICVDILEEMLKDEDCLKFLSFPACIVATGVRGVIREIVKRKWFDVIITTCGTLDHDLARSWRNYYHGNFLMDDRELHRRGVNRLGNVLIPNESYGAIIEEKMGEFLQEIYNEGKRELATYELCWEIGRRIKNVSSILYWCWKNKIYIIVPGITDGAVGYQIWQFSQTHQFKIDLLKDEKLLCDLVWEAKKSGALIIGGGISKHHVLWWNQFKDGLNYAVYITTAVEWDGSLSGARTREAISWGKISEEADQITVEGDATVLLPLIFSALLERLE
ncbi:deoxyhypusine synthase [Candidatus Geothermarchaeota archaeon]|mgnify:CR=1 FL=1|nr:MAG: deoxyhypusine synthase [Candidatus Geothermarchaeota archaeon]